MKVWDPEWKPNRRKSGQEGHVESKLGCFGRSWLQFGLSWEMLEARWIQGSNHDRQDESPEAPRREERGGVRVIDPGVGSLVPTILRLQDPKILRFENPKIRKPLSSLKTPLILRYNFEAPLTLRSSHSLHSLVALRGSI